MAVSRRCVPTRWTYEELTKIEATETDMRRGAKGLEIYARRALDKVIPFSVIYVALSKITYLD